MKEKLSTAFIVVFWIVLACGVVWWLAQSHTDSSAPATTTEPSGQVYDNCTDAHNDGVYDIPESSPSYVSSQDADHDGVACEHYLGN